MNLHSFLDVGFIALLQLFAISLVSRCIIADLEGEKVHYRCIKTICLDHEDLHSCLGHLQNGCEVVA